jgi:hypothetical protein
MKKIPALTKSMLLLFFRLVPEGLQSFTKHEAHLRQNG